MEKIPYTPNENKRFFISEDKFSRERLDKLKVIYKDLQVMLGPEINCAMTLYGSLAKGKLLDEKAAEVSDVDCVLYIDIEDVMKKVEALEQGETPKNAFEEIILAETKKVLEEADWEEDIEKKEITCICAKSAIESFFSKIFYKKYEDKTYSFEFRQISTQGEYTSIIDRSDRLDEFMENSENYTFLNFDMIEMVRFFSLDIGGNMKRYRQDFFHKISTLNPELAQKKWKNIWHAIIFTERNIPWNKEVPPEVEKLYPPKNYKEAIKYYGVNI